MDDPHAPLKDLARDLTPYPDPPDNQRVRALLGADDKGQMQIIAPEAALVDPEPIRNSTARTLRSVPEAPDSRVCAIPGYYGLPSVIDRQLKEQPSVALATEQPGDYVRVSGAQLAKMCDSHASFDTEFSRSLVPTPMAAERDEQAILQAVDNFTRRRIQARLDETLHIPPLPEAAQRIIALQQETDYDLQDLVEIVERDPAMAARIMGWANSAFYGNNTPAKTLNDAIMRVLGFDLVFNMALGMAIGATLNLPEHHVSGASPYWLDAVYRAATMEALSHQFDNKIIDTKQQANPGLSYLTGLLSNFGTLVVGHVFPPQYETICRIEEANPQLSHTYVDQHVLSINREVIAANLLKQWAVPDPIVHGIRYQYVDDYEGENAIYARLLSFAQTLLAVDVPNHPHLPDHVMNEGVQLGLRVSGINEVADVLRQSQAQLWDLAQALA
ncbi:MAG: HDOD domain-containing protein [Pseudomonadota bacterium]